VLLGARPAAAQAVIKVNDDVSFRLGLLAQGWADWNQDAASEGYVQNLFLRRARIFLGGTVAKNVSFFFMTDNPNLGKAQPGLTKSLGTGFILQDGYVEWKVSNEFQLQGGLILMPLCRNCNQSAASHLTLDYGTWSFQQSASTQSSVGRDTGFQAKGYFLKDHLEYRIGAYQGFREASGRNAFRSVGRIMYNIFDVEKVQFYPGTYLGKKKIVALGAGYDIQQDYNAYAADAFVDWGLPGGDGITFQADYIYWNGGKTFNVANLYRQNDLLFEAGYYMSKLKLLPWVRFESQKYDQTVRENLNKENYQLGLTWYPYGQNFNIRAAYTYHRFPSPATSRNLNQFTVQLQAFYF